MAKDSRGHGSNAREMHKLDATPWDKLNEEQKTKLRAWKDERSASAPSLYEGAPSSVTRRKAAQNAAGLQALGNTVKANPEMRAAALSARDLSSIKGTNNRKGR